jgi:NADPH:quinone reductase-like Zn-dependent oxidoreductase
MHEAGCIFRTLFRSASLDGIATSQLIRLPGATTDTVSTRQIDARRRVAEALDALGGPATGALAAALDDGGTVVVYGLMSGEPSALPAHDLVFRGVTVRGFWLARWFADPANRAPAKGLYPELAAQLAAGALRMSVGAVHDLADAAIAVQAAAQPARAGKVLLRGAWWDRPL